MIVTYTSIVLFQLLNLQNCFLAQRTDSLVWIRIPHPLFLRSVFFELEVVYAPF